MVRTKLAAAILGASIMLPGLASALGVGDYTLKSYLNQPLELEIDLIQTQDLSAEEVLAALASQDDFNRAGVDRTFFLTDIRFEIKSRSDGRMTVIARSRKPVNEPFLNFLMEVQWPQGRLLREYTILLDPPVYKAGAIPTATAEPIVVAAEPAPVVVAPAAAPVVAPVAVERRSSLPPPPSGVVARAPAPTRESPAQPAGRDAGAGEYRVQGSDTMWNIAARHRAEGATVQQTMIAIQRANPDAFIAGNVNLVRTGQVLRIPTQSEVQQLSDSSAGADIASQNRAWREMLDERAVSTPSGDATLESRKAPAAAGAAPRATGAGEVKLVAPAASAAAGKVAGGKETEALKGKLSAAEEELAKAARQNKELSSRLAEVEKQVAGSDKLLSLKASQIAELQAELNRLRKDKGLAPVAAPVVAEAKPAEAKAEATEPVAAEPATPAPEAAVAAGPEKTAEAMQAEKAAKAKADKAAKAEKKAKEKGSSLLVPIAGALALLGIGGGAFWYLRKRKEQAPKPATEFSYEPDDHDAQVADDLAQLSDLNLDLDDANDLHASATEVSPAASDSESADPLGEADMYMAYGRFPQAADILYAALQREPEREDIRLKLAEVYVEMGDESAAAEHLTALSGSRKEDIRTQANALLAKVGGGAAAATLVTPAVSGSEPSLDDLALEFSGGQQQPAQSSGLSFELSDDMGEMPVANSDALEFSLDEFDAAAEPGAEEFSLDDADMGDFSLQDEVAAVPAAEPAAEFTLDDDLGLSDEMTLEDAVGNDDLSLELSDDLAPAAEAAGDAFEFDAIDKDAQTQVMRAVTDADIAGFEAEEEVVAAEPPAMEEPVQEDVALDLESELADLDADLHAEGVGAEAEGGDDFDFLADSDENATKLDLARAYIEMGDAEGARDILNEVVADGNDVQKTEARSLLSQVS